MPLNFSTRGLIRLLAWFAALGVACAHALTLGEPRVRSEPGQPLVVELPLRQLGALKSQDLRVRWAPAPAWQAAGLTWRDLPGVELRVNDQPEGPVVLIRTSEAVDTASWDVLIELQWPNGRLQREIGLLLPASGGKEPFVAVPTALWVQAGDTASALSASHLDPQAPQSQALAALVQANPDAFVQGNVNRLRAGAVLTLPSAEQMRSIDPQSAREWLNQQMQEFAVYRRELAAQAQADQNVDSPQVSSGKIQSATPQAKTDGGDRLTLSTSGADDSDHLAAQRQAQQTAQRASELNRNIQDLNRLAQGEQGAGVPLPVPLPPPTTPPVSERIEDWVHSPATPWATAILVLLLCAWTLGRVMRPAPVVSPTPSAADEPAPSSPLKVDFDLHLPEPESLPPLPERVSQAPTPVARLQTARQAPVQASNPSWLSVSDLSLEAPDPVQTSTTMPQDPHALRLELAGALWQQGLTQTARVLVREVMVQANPDLAEQARRWLDERG